MTVVKIPETMLAYKTIELNPDGISIQSVVEKTRLPPERVTEILNTFADDGLISCQHEVVFAVKWWELQRLEVVFQLPWVADNVFEEVCQDLRALSRDIRSDSYYTLQPYSHETTLQVIISLASGIVLAEFFRAFFKEWGTKAAAVCDAFFQKHRRHGIKEISVSGTFQPHRDGVGVKFNFDVKGTSKDEILRGLEFIEKELITALKSKRVSSEFLKEADNWRIAVWRA